MAMRLAPEKAHPSSKTLATVSAPSVPGLNDSLRANLCTGLPSEAASRNESVLTSSHPLEARLANWEKTMNETRAMSLRQVYGLAETVRRGMEVKVVRDGEWRFSGIGGGERSLSEEILRGTEASISWEDVYKGSILAPERNVGDELERKVKMAPIA